MTADDQSDLFHFSGV